MNNAPKWLTDGLPIAHRCSHTDGVPENSRTALKSSLELGVPIEIDLQLTKDLVPIVFHDRRLDRLCGVSGSVTRNYWEWIKTHPLKMTGESILSFEELLAIVNGEVPIVVEVKPAKIRHSARSKETMNLLNEYNGDFVVKSFDPRIVKWFKKHTDYPTGLIVGRYKDKTQSTDGKQRFQETWNKYISENRKGLTHDFISHDIATLTPTISDTIREKRSLPLVTWTINDEKKALQASVLSDNYIFEGFTPTVLNH